MSFDNLPLADLIKVKESLERKKYGNQMREDIQDYIAVLSAIAEAEHRP